MQFDKLTYHSLEAGIVAAVASQRYSLANMSQLPNASVVFL